MGHGPSPQEPSPHGSRTHMIWRYRGRTPPRDGGSIFLSLGVARTHGARAPHSHRRGSRGSPVGGANEAK
eukprot:7146318-Prymnesium_polylepis.1